MNDKNSQLEESLKKLAATRARKLVADYVDPTDPENMFAEFSILVEILDVAKLYANDYAATREAEGRKQGALKLWAKISVAVGLWLPAFNSKPEEAKAAKMLIKVMTNEKDDYLQALTDTQGEKRG